MFGEQCYMSFRSLEMAPTYSISRYAFQGKGRFYLHAAYSEKLIQDLRS